MNKEDEEGFNKGKFEQRFCPKCGKEVIAMSTEVISLDLRDNLVAHVVLDMVFIHEQ